jgi:hypothetical protein
MRAMCCGVLAAVALCGFAMSGAAQDSSVLGLLELHFKPTGYSQLAAWIERSDGSFLATARLTEAVAYRGIGNRPGASQMNSGFRWPYGRREGVLPIWATRRASVPGARMFRRVIFQDRDSEGLASRTSNDFSTDNYYCLSFNAEKSSQDALDAMSCASVFNSDKGRFVADADVVAQYAEPYEDPATQASPERTAHMRVLSAFSLYPPRRDIAACTERPACFDHPDVATFDQHVREVMPDIDTVTMATPAADVPQRILFPLPSDWLPGDYRACVEINKEGDYNEVYGPALYPVPRNPANKWDSWAMNYGYPYRGQPSVVYCTDFQIGGSAEQAFSSAVAVGSSGPYNFEDPTYGQLRTMDGMTDDPIGAPGSGGDRLELMEDGFRLKVVVKPPLSCRDDAPPSAIADFSVENHRDKLNAHQWASLSFRAATDDQGVVRYDVRVSTQPITDDQDFRAAMPAKQATIEAPELLVPLDKQPGEMIRVDMGGLVQATHYFVAVRAMDGCTSVGPMSVQEITTPEREFSTVTPCFVATAAWGSPLAERVSVLRGFRDRYLLSHGVGRALVSAYYAVGPAFADFIRKHESARAAVRLALTPAVELGRELAE